MQKMGKRQRTVADVYQPTRVKSRPPSGSRAQMGTSKTAVQFVICAAVFVLFVAVKLLLPQKMALINTKLDAAMERNMDVKTVFSAVGSIFTENETVSRAANEVYQAVFQMEQPAALQTAAAYRLEVPSALTELQLYRKESQREEAEALPLPEQAVSEAEDPAYIQYSDQNLPDNVSMEQAILGLEYCTPVEGRLSSSFGYREHPTEGGERFHYGLDLAADTGTPIRCFASGTVTAVGESSSYGKYCVVRHDNGCSTLYAHCSRVLATSGSAVSKNDKIAEVGESGMATGPHLHFELQKDGVYLNPIYYVSAQ